MLIKTVELSSSADIRNRRMPLLVRMRIVNNTSAFRTKDVRRSASFKCITSYFKERGKVEVSKHGSIVNIFKTFSDSQVL
jgi:hypothetical protein